MTFKPVILTASLAIMFLSSVVRAEIDGHGPDAWLVTDIDRDNALSAHMGPGRDYPIIDHFAANEHGLQQVTCVPLLLGDIHAKLSESELQALPPRWCLMRSADLTKAGWVEQRFITPDYSSHNEITDEDPVTQATMLVRRLYKMSDEASRGRGQSPLMPGLASDFFTADIVDLIHSGQLTAHPLYNAQDFEVEIHQIEADPERPMFRGMITINVDFSNFGHAQRAVFYLRSDTMREDAAIRIFHIEHDGWELP